MHRRQDIGDAAIEAFFTGNGAGDEFPSLAALAEDLRRVASGPPPVPSPPLAALLADGFSVDACERAFGLTAQLPRRRSTGRVVAELLVGLGVASKVLLGVGVAAASVTAVGAAGALPGPVQDVVAATVAAVTPFSLPGTADDAADFGRRVSTDARNDGVDGRVVSEQAGQNGATHRADEAVENQGPLGEPGQPGLERSGENPAAGRIPTRVPSGRPATAGPVSPAPVDLSAGGGLPSAGSIPEVVPAEAGPAGGTTDDAPPGSTRADSSGGSPTASSVPAPVPTHPPGGRS